jgi:hypothetical protein
LSAQVRLIGPPPPEFADQFILGGWRQVERVYGARTDVILKWIAVCGGLEDLQARRKAARAVKMAAAKARYGKL